MTYKKKIIYFIIMLCGLLFGQASFAGDLNLINFQKVYSFENSFMYSMGFEDLRPLVYIEYQINSKMTGSCTGFFLKNKNNKHFVMSSRHCFLLDLASKCGNDNPSIYGYSSDGNWVRGKCKNIIASSNKDDAIIFEVEFLNTFILPENTYMLAATERPVCSRVELKGFMSDPRRDNQQVVYHNCWTQSKFSTHADASFDNDVFKLLQTERLKNEQLTSEYQQSWTKTWNELNFTYGYHNCSVNGGNSGGPILLEDQPIAIGIPIQYESHEYSVPSKFHAIYESIPGFVKRHKKVLLENGIITIDKYNTEKFRACIEL